MQQNGQTGEVPKNQALVKKTNKSVLSLFNCIDDNYESSNNIFKS